MSTTVSFHGPTEATSTRGSRACSSSSHAAPPTRSHHAADHDDTQGTAAPPAPQILALHHDRNHLGFAVYESLTGTLHVGASDDLDLPPHHDRVHALVAMYLPSVCLISARSPLHPVLASADPHVVVDERPTQDFVYANARATLANVVRGWSHSQGPPGVRNAHAGKQALVELDALLGGGSGMAANMLSMACAGALCRFLDALRLVQQHHHPIDDATTLASTMATTKHDPDVHWGTRSNFGSPPPPRTPAPLSRYQRRHPLAVDDPYLDTMSVAGTLPARPSSSSSPTAAASYDFTIHHLVLATPSDTLHLSPSTGTALQLFDTPGTPAPSTSPEFTCVMHVLDATRSVDGKWRLRAWMARPLARVEEINARLDAVAYLAAPANAGLVRAVRGHLVHVKALGKLLSKNVLAPGEWRAVSGTLRAGVAIVDAVSTAAPSSGEAAVPKLLRGLVPDQDSDLVPSATRAMALVDNILDMDTSLREGRCIVQPGVDDQLDHLKHQFDQLPDLLSDVARDVAVGLPRALQPHVNVVYLPQIGYLVLLPRDALADYLGGPHMPLDTYTVPGLDLQFSTPAYGYFKSPRMHDLDAALGDLYGMITDRELEIVFVLREAIKELDLPLRTLHSHLVTLDVLVSLAEAATRFGYTRPALIPAGQPLHADDVRHPLLERLPRRGAATAYIPNSVHLGHDAQRTWVLTGANASGKSVYLKSVALLVYLAHMGSFVPARAGARVPLTDAILSRMAAADSVSRGVSAFVHDVQQVAHIVRRATPRSLVLVDEFGKGTSVADGVGLFVGLVEYLAKLPRAEEDVAAGPLVIAATHFHDILAHNLLSPNLGIGTLTTQILLHPPSTSSSTTSATSDPRVVCLYRVTQGTCTSSYAAHCAAAARVPARIVHRGTLAAHAIASGERLTSVAEDVRRACEQRLEDHVGEFLTREVDLQVMEVMERGLCAPQESGVYAMLVTDDEEHDHKETEQ